MALAASLADPPPGSSAGPRRHRQGSASLGRAAYDEVVVGLARSRSALRRSLPVFGAFAVGAIAYAPLYCFPMVSVAFGAEFHAGRELSAMPWTMFLLVSAISSPLLGHAYDVVADRILLLAGMILLAAGWLVAAAASDVAFLVIGYGAFLAIGLQLVFVGTTTAIARRYAGIAGLALGIAYSGPGIGLGLTLPVVAAALPEFGWRGLSTAFAVLSLVGLPFVWLMTTGPAVVVPGQSGDARGLHETSAPGAIAASLEPLPAGSRPRAQALRRTLRTRRFLILLLGAVAIGCIDEGIFQMSPLHAVTRGISADFAATALSVQAYAYVAGQVLGGGLSDRFGRRFVGLVAAAIAAVGATLTFAADGSTLPLSIAGNALYGCGIGATVAIRSAAFSDVFGGHNFGSIFGIIAVAYPAGGIIVMNAGAILYDRIGSYWPVYGIAMVSLVVWTIALVVAGPRRHGLRARLEVVRARLPG